MENLKINTKTEMEIEEDEQPVSPIGQYFNSSILSSTVVSVIESEVPINTDDSHTTTMLRNFFLPINPRFSSIMVDDKNGERHWKKVEVNIGNHVHVPKFPDGKSLEYYDKCLEEYLTKLSAEQMPQSQPLWGLHIFKYPTSNAAGSVIFQLHHALGDGYSLMGALLSCLQRADDPSLPLTFPSAPPDDFSSNIFKSVPKFFSTMFNTATDFWGSVIKSSLVDDDITPLRSGSALAGWGPMSIKNMAFPLHQIKHIKDNHGVTINDVLTGAIFLGTRLYMHAMKKESASLQSTAVVLLNTRMLKSMSSVEDMVKPDTMAPWGNHFAFLHVSIPKLIEAELENPLEFVRKAQEGIETKRNSFGVFLIAKLLDTVKKLRGTLAAAKLVHGSLNKSTMAITNMMGPLERMSLANHPIKGLYFMVTGSPQSLVVTIVSYTGTVRISIGGEEGFVDSLKLKACIENAFQVILNASESHSGT